SSSELRARSVALMPAERTSERTLQSVSFRKVRSRTYEIVETMRPPRSSKWASESARPQVALRCLPLRCSAVGLGSPAGPRFRSGRQKIWVPIQKSEVGRAPAQQPVRPARTLSPPCAVTPRSQRLQILDDVALLRVSQPKMHEVVIVVDHVGQRREAPIVIEA